jgi:hypothetical protein
MDIKILKILEYDICMKLDIFQYLITLLLCTWSYYYTLACRCNRQLCFMRVYAHRSMQFGVYSYFLLMWDNFSFC